MALDFSICLHYQDPVSTADRNARILSLRKEGLLAPAIQRRLAEEGYPPIGTTRIRQILLAAGVAADPGRPPGPGKPSSEARRRKEQAIRLRSKGYAIRKIADELSVSERAVSGYLSSEKKKTTG